MLTGSMLVQSLGQEMSSGEPELSEPVKQDIIIKGQRHHVHEKPGGSTCVGQRPFRTVMDRVSTRPAVLDGIHESTTS